MSIFSPSKEPLPGVRVELLGTNKTYYTNLKGQVTIPSNFNISLYYISYRTKIINKDSIKSLIILTHR